MKKFFASLIAYILIVVFMIYEWIKERIRG